MWKADIFHEEIFGVGEEFLLGQSISLSEEEGHSRALPGPRLTSFGATFARLGVSYFAFSRSRGKVLFLDASFALLRPPYTNPPLPFAERIAHLLLGDLLRRSWLIDKWIALVSQAPWHSRGRLPLLLLLSWAPRGGVALRSKRTTRSLSHESTGKQAPRRKRHWRGGGKERG